MFSESTRTIQGPLLFKLSGRSKKRWRCQQEDSFPLLEKEACPCSEFHTQPQGPWSPCLLLPAKNIAGPPFIQGVSHQSQQAVQGWRPQRKNSECGHGKRFRALACLDPMKRLVEPALCSSPGDALLQKSKIKSFVIIYIYIYIYINTYIHILNIL